MTNNKMLVVRIRSSMGDYFVLIINRFENDFLKLFLLDLPLKFDLLENDFRGGGFAAAPTASLAESE